MLTINHDTARDVFGLMMERYMTRRYPFQQLEVDLPQNMVRAEVQDDPYRLALHLFYSCHYMRGTVISSHAFRVLNQLQEESPWLFQPEVAGFVSPGEIADTLGKYIPWQKTQVGTLWRNNSRVLQEEWQGDPREIFRGVTTKEDCYRRVMGRKFKEYGMEGGKRRRLYQTDHTGFGGFQEKMTSMLAYFLEATNLIKPTMLSAPIDFHHLRIYLATGMIMTTTSDVRYEHVKELGIKLAEWLQAEFGLTQVQYGDIVWLWSIRSCRIAPQNASIEETKTDGKIVRVPVPLTWSVEQTKAYAKSCGRCALSKRCQYAVPAGPYYTTGRFTLLKRKEPPQWQQMLSLIDDVPMIRRPRPIKQEGVQKSSPVNMSQGDFFTRFGG
jgi:hypothetical protein